MVAEGFLDLGDRQVFYFHHGTGGFAIHVPHAYGGDVGSRFGDDLGDPGQLSGSVYQVYRHSHPATFRAQQLQHRFEDVGVGDDPHRYVAAHDHEAADAVFGHRTGGPVLRGSADDGGSGSAD